MKQPKNLAQNLEVLNNPTYKMLCSNPKKKKKLLNPFCYCSKQQL